MTSIFESAYFGKCSLAMVEKCIKHCNFPTCQLWSFTIQKVSQGWSACYYYCWSIKMCSKVDCGFTRKVCTLDIRYVRTRTSLKVPRMCPFCRSSPVFTWVEMMYKRRDRYFQLTMPLDLKRSTIVGRILQFLEHHGYEAHRAMWRSPFKQWFRHLPIRGTT